LLTDVVDQSCRERNHAALAQLKAAQPDVVLLEAIWYPSDAHLEGLVATIEHLKHIGIPRIVVLGRVPVWESGLKYRIFDFYRRHRVLPQRLPLPLADNWFDARMRERLEPLGINFVSAWDALCTRGTDCLATLQTDGTSRPSRPTFCISPRPARHI
jgi:hypothetical protein